MSNIYLVFASEFDKYFLQVFFFANPKTKSFLDVNCRDDNENSRNIQKFLFMKASLFEVISNFAFIIYDV